MWGKGTGRGEGEGGTRSGAEKTAGVRGDKERKRKVEGGGPGGVGIIEM